jgi:hypothetical protein
LLFQRSDTSSPTRGLSFCSEAACPTQSLHLESPTALRTGLVRGSSYDIWWVEGDREVPRAQRLNLTNMPSSPGAEPKNLRPRKEAQEPRAAAPGRSGPLQFSSRKKNKT